MNKKLIIITCVLGLALCISLIYKFQKTTPSVPDRPGPLLSLLPEEPKYTFEDAIDSITLEELNKGLYYLASDNLEGRMSGKKGNIEAAEWIKKQYESFGLKTMYHKFSIQRINPGPKNEKGDNFTRNIYAWIEGNDTKLKDEIVIIGAHMDHIGYGPYYSRSRRRGIHNGADDNASGTVALLEIAQAFSLLKDKVKRTIVFQSYSGEEMGLIGSRFYCNSPTFPVDDPNIRKHVFMLNMDMIGYLAKGKYHTSFHAGESSPDINRIIHGLNSKYIFADVVTSRSSGGSDHAAFYNKGIPIAFLHTGLHDNYHTPSDTSEKINYEGLEQITKYGFELVWQVVQEDSRPKFNTATFKVLPYTHDHGHPEVPFLQDRNNEHDHDKVNP